ncbi:MAG: DNA repair protein RecN [Clostridia bacterium]|nr:DNA repair protein RecN [Clostridia bacterium]
MLLSLHIENVAIIRSLDIDFSSGFTALTGETGAGKSILIDSIHFLMGGRAERDLIRRGADSASVSGLFGDLLPTVASKLSELGAQPDEDGTLLIERRFHADSRSSARINGRAVNLSLLREVAAMLISIHGQNDNHLLLQRKNYLSILDSYASVEPLLRDYRTVYEHLIENRNEIAALKRDEGEKLRECEMLRYQISDIESAHIKLGEEDALLTEKAKIRNMEKIFKQADFAYRALKGSEKGSAYYLILRASDALQKLSDILPSGGKAAELLESSLSGIEAAAEIAAEMSADCVDAPEKRLDEIEERLDIITKMRRKYGADEAAILSFLKNARERLELLETADARIEELQKQQKDLLQKADAAADQLHQKRAAAAKELSCNVCSVLSFLDMPKVKFEVSVARNQDDFPFTANGADTVLFLVSANPGEPLGDLSHIASGGELSRIMLALKSAITDKDGIPTVIYDEVDTGVSGKTARKVGIQLKRSAESIQVLCVTHSAQIASLADCHSLIHKEEVAGRNETQVRVLDRQGRIDELARILGGISVTEAQYKAAEDLMVYSD